MSEPSALQPTEHTHTLYTFPEHYTRLNEGIWDKSCPACAAALDRAANAASPQAEPPQQERIIKEIAEKASKFSDSYSAALWALTEYQNQATHSPAGMPQDNSPDKAPEAPGGSYPASDQNFIIHAKSDIPYLLSLVRHQQAEIERLRRALIGF